MKTTLQPADILLFCSFNKSLLPDKVWLPQACVALATYVLPVAAADAQTMAEAVQSIEDVLAMPLLLRAVRSQSMPLVSHPAAHAQPCYAMLGVKGVTLAGMLVLTLHSGHCQPNPCAALSHCADAFIINLGFVGLRRCRWCLSGPVRLG